MRIIFNNCKNRNEIGARIKFCFYFLPYFTRGSAAARIFWKESGNLSFCSALFAAAITMSSISPLLLFLSEGKIKNIFHICWSELNQFMNFSFWSFTDKFKGGKIISSV